MAHGCDNGKLRHRRCRSGHSTAAMVAASGVLLLALLSAQQMSAPSAGLAGRKRPIWQGDSTEKPVTSEHTKFRSNAGSRAICRNARARAGSTLDNILDHSNPPGSVPPLSHNLVPVMIHSRLCCGVTRVRSTRASTFCGNGKQYVPGLDCWH